MGPPKRTWLVVVAVLAVSLGFNAASAWAHSGVRSQIEQTISRQPTPFTELYFTSPSDLPKRLPPSGPAGFEFTIVNHEGHATDYHFVVSGETPDFSEPIGGGDVTVSDGAAATIPVALMPAEIGTDYEVSVRLVGRLETIHFASKS